MSKCGCKDSSVKDIVREKYGAAALKVLEGEAHDHHGVSTASSCCCSGEVVTGNLYSAAETAGLPEAAKLASLGCGNPFAVASLAAGESVLDLGSGGGIDVFLSAKRVGPSGFVYGLDMTDEMLELAEKNKAEAGITNVKFLKGNIEEIPLPDASVDVVISNCVINLSSDKARVFKEAYRVLKPGGRFAVADVIVEGELPDAIRSDMSAYVGCVAGALEKQDCISKLEAAGFKDVEIDPFRRYTFADLEAATCSAETVRKLTAAEREKLDGRILSAFIRAYKRQALSV